MVDVTGISPARGSLYGGQVVTITGTGFGATAGTVTLEGRACTITAWSATSITVTTPRRMNGDALVFGGGTVSLVVTGSDATSDSASYEYAATLSERAFQSVRNSLGALSLQGGSFFEWSPSQVRPIKMDQLTQDNGAEYPQAIVYETDAIPMPDDSPHGFLVSEHRGVMQAVYPMARLEDVDYQLDQLIADLYAGLMADTSQGGVVISTDYTGSDKGRIDNAADGSLAVASITFKMTIQTAYNDFTRNHAYTVT